ncbi:hypothetical protein PS947_04479 [Pseudomonas fluorescens]|nr:hypothetical protein PS947_04479 [Pseudomonas fluorescens]
MTLQSHAVTLEHIVKQGMFFQIPVYQRLYVWGDEQVRTLLDDLWSAYEAKSPLAYLGGILVVPRHQDRTTVEYDLIDGQQRFTTLWLLALSLGRKLKPFLAARRAGEVRPRLGFPIRPDIEKAFKASCIDGQAPAVAHEKIDNALGIIQRFKQSLDEAELAAFSDYVLNNVTVIMTHFPASMDLNKIFELINNRGQQLQHHEILKARLLQHIRNAAERESYAALWEACSYMDDYVERNLRRVTRLDVHALFSAMAAKQDDEALAWSDSVLEALANKFEATREARPLTLDAILAGKALALAEPVEALPDVNQGESKVRSIISFSMLLQHALRIWLHERDEPDIARINDKDLLSLFDAHMLKSRGTSANVKSFLALLWEVRYCFDKHVIKWVPDDAGEEHHQILDIRKRKSESAGDKTYWSLVRDEGDNNEFALLQSMLYHSQQITTHYWLTPLLAYIRANRTGRAHYLKQLKHLDNHLLCGNDSGRPLIERSHDFLDDPFATSSLVDPVSYFTKPLGLKFPHYWFYKLEFVLWSTNALQLSAQQLSQFRMTAKNSIEHISPQTAQRVERFPVSAEVLDTFGNLALVSRGINSEYGNKPFSEKRAHFREHNRERIDSLKMKLIYDQQDWGDDQAATHQRHMVEVLSQYLGLTTTERLAIPA